MSPKSIETFTVETVRKNSWTAERSHHNAATIYMSLVFTSQGGRCGCDNDLL